MDPKVLRLNIVINIVLSQVVVGRATDDTDLIHSVGGCSAAAMNRDPPTTLAYTLRFWMDLRIKTLRLTQGL